MPIGRMVGPLRDGRDRQFFDGGVLLDLNMTLIVGQPSP